MLRIHTFLRLNQIDGKLHKLEIHNGIPELIYIILKELLSSLTLNWFTYIKSSFLHFKTIIPRKNKIPYLTGINLFAYNSLFWLSASNEITRNGITGKSCSAGDGNYNLTSWWFYTPISLHLYRWLGVGLSFLCITIAPFGYFYNWENTEFIAIGILFLYYSSPAVYSMAFVVGRYHSVAWALVPLSLVIADVGSYEKLIIALVIIAITSSTVMFIVTLLMIVMAIINQSIFLIYAIIPGLMLSAGYVLYLNIKSQGNEPKSASILDGIGAVKRAEAQYKRSDLGHFSPVDYWYLFAGIIYFIIALLTFSNIPYLFVLVYLLLVINTKLSRFADNQTIQYLLVIVGLFELSQYAVSELALLAPILLVGQSFLHKVGVSYFGGILKPIKPLDLTKEINTFRQLFQHINKCEKVYIPLKNPNGLYSHLFNGYRHSIELPIYVGSELGINVFPNWHMVFKYNYYDAPNYWIDKTHSIIEVCQKWGASYILLNKSEFQEQTKNINYEHLGNFSFDLNTFDDWSRNNFKNPDWELIKISLNKN